MTLSSLKKILGFKKVGAAKIFLRFLRFLRLFAAKGVGEAVPITSH